MPFISGSYFSKIVMDLIGKFNLNNLQMFIATGLNQNNIENNYSEIVKKIYSKPIDINCIKDIFRRLDIQ